ncbi:MAG TPA: hypothetical protein VFE16_05045 [Candidatus Cybelea sp.]|nr:hypothetical protein [Candidatus Cybelea sp.]
MVATVNGQPITRAALNQRLAVNPNPQMALMGLEADMLLDQYAASNKITITDGAIAAREDAIKMMSPHLSWATVVGKPHATDADIRAFVRRQLIIDHGVAYGVHISPVQVKQYYLQHRASFQKAGRPETLAEATPEISSLLHLQAAAGLTPDFVGSLLQNAKIVVNDPKYAQVVATPTP